MECPKCKKEVSELDEKCPKCGLIFEEYEAEKKNNEETDINRDKTAFLKIINLLQLIGSAIMMIIQISNEEQIQGIISITIGIVLFAFIKGFINIIDLLDEINRKIDKK